MVACTINRRPNPPNNISREWARFVQAHGLPNVMFQALRHTHASALLAAGVDIMVVSRRIGRTSAAVTLRVYGHLFRKADDTAAAATEAALRTDKRR
jgi:integrase